MKVLVITGSPHKKGTSALLADSFIKGALSAGHEVVRFDAAFENVHPCQGCMYCWEHESSCVYQDAMTDLNPVLFGCDMVVFVTPLYYFGMTAQMKRVIDRFFANNEVLRKNAKKTALLVTCGDQDKWAVDALKAHYQTVCQYLGWQDVGSLTAFGVYTREDIEKTDYPKQAFDFGASLS
ncbi:flavodoxin family protein [Candidatus Soleaferrea massiliensis]|uniref:flavodoxin family protein n=1 Tax=Candidatus Soleaferrea massiliensis TaxID=1470354 RepID=UPI00058E3BDA|nr:flavodoxin family protein [Candidatus Soleaferrea massiliensis]